MSEAGLFAVVLAALSLAADAVPAPPANPAPGAVPVSDQPSMAPAAGAQCDAPSLAYLVGKPRTDIPVPIDPSSRRVYCSSCVITEDYRPDRTDIVFDDRTGLVTAVKCG